MLVNLHSSRKMKVAFNKFFGSVSGNAVFLISIKLVLIEVAHAIQNF